MQFNITLTEIITLTISIIFFIFAIIILINANKKNQQNKTLCEKALFEQKNFLSKLFTENKYEMQNIQNKSEKEMEVYFGKLQKQILEHMRINANENHENQIKNLKYLQNTITSNLQQYANDMRKNFNSLTDAADKKLQQISGQVEKRLSDGFEKTTKTFEDIVKRLALIDDAQKKLAELSNNIISLQDILADKKSRGAFGEIQLKNLIENMLPSENYNLQYTLQNGNRADCVLFLPEPTGNIIIDAKFPLENFHILTKVELSNIEKNKAEQNFKTDIKKHVNDIANKYIIPGETSDGAIMFIPAEAVFSEIHRNFQELVNYAHTKRIFIASPTTMMAILTTASAVIKDSKTRKHIHIIQEHLRFLAKDFSRFEDRMQKLTNYIDKAQENAHQVNTSAKKISNRFQKIEKAQIKDEKLQNENLEDDLKDKKLQNESSENNLKDKKEILEIE